MITKAILVEDTLEDGRPGAYNFDRDADGKIIGIRFFCGCGCGAFHRLDLVKVEGRPSWNLVNENPVSITPSIRALSGCQMHCMLTDGEFRIDNK